MYLEFDKTQHTTCHRLLITPKLFVFFYSASLGCLLPFLPIFFRLNGLSAIQNGCLVSARYLILFWSAPVFSFMANKLNIRKTVLILSVLLGAVANTAFLFMADYKATVKDCEIGENNNSSINSTAAQVHVFNNTTNVHAIMRRNSDTGNNSEHKNQFTNSFEQQLFNTIGLLLDNTFLTFLIIMVVGTLISSPAKPLHETVTLALTKEFKESFNVQRLCGCLGWSLMALVTAMAVYKVPCTLTKFTHNLFNLHFIVNIVFSTSALVMVAIMKSPTQKSTTRIKLCRILRVSCHNPNIIVVIVTMAILGMAQSLHSTYLLWYVQDHGGNEVHMGLVVLVAGLSQIPMLYATKYVIHWLGHGWVFFLALFAYGCRFLLYSYVTHPLMFLPVELLHSLSSSSIWIASMSVAVLVSPIGLERSMQNIFTASYYGLGMGCGGLLSSIGYQLYGPVLVFQCAAIVCAVYSLVVALLQCLISAPDENQGFPINGDYYKVRTNNTGNNAQQSDWLLDALNAEEEEIHYSR